MFSSLSTARMDGVTFSGFSFFCIEDAEKKKDDCISVNNNVDYIFFLLYTRNLDS